MLGLILTIPVILPTEAPELRRRLGKICQEKLITLMNPNADPSGASPALRIPILPLASESRPLPPEPEQKLSHAPHSLEPETFNAEAVTLRFQDLFAFLN